MACCQAGFIREPPWAVAERGPRAMPVARAAELQSHCRRLAKFKDSLRETSRISSGLDSIIRSQGFTAEVVPIPSPISTEFALPSQPSGEIFADQFFVEGAQCGHIHPFIALGV